MTKINKLGKSTFVIAILSFLLVAVLAFGGTYAYFSAQSTAATGSVTTGYLKIGTVKEGEATVTDTLTMSGTVQPNQVIYDNTLKLDVEQNIAYYTRLKLTVSVDRALATDANSNGKYDDGDTYKYEHNHDTETSCADYVDAALKILTFTTDAGWETTTDDADFATTGDSAELYFYQLEPTAKDATDPEEFALKIQVKPIMGLAVSGSADGCQYWMEATITVTVQFEVLQADYLNDGTTPGGNFGSGDDAAAAWTTALTGVEA